MGKSISKLHSPHRTVSGDQHHEDRGVEPSAPEVSSAQKKQRAHSDSVASAVYCGTPWVLASGGADNTVVVSEWNREEQPRRLNGHSRAVTQVLWSLPLRHLFSCSRDKSIRMWDETVGSCLQAFQGHAMTVAGIATCQSTLVSGSRDGTLMTWSVDTGVCTNSAHVNRNVVTCIRAIKRCDGERREFVQASEDKMLRVWDVNSLKIELQLPRQQYIHTSCDATDDGTMLLCGSNGLDGHGCHATLWDRRMAGKAVEIAAHAHGVTDCRFLPKTSAFPEQLFVTSSLDSTIKVWSANHADKALASFALGAGGSVHGLDAIPGPGGVINIVAGTSQGDVLVLGLRSTSGDHRRCALTQLASL
eukprot:m.977375 g.977375  ORF g.977375 m.977375 type:complete len:361 (-) comp23952_c0_seq1:3552-4634(-)